MRKVSLAGEKIHEPAEGDGAQDHDEKEGDPVPDLGFCLIAANEGQDDTDQKGIEDHGQKVALENHFFFPRAMS
jgi:hypothetical protein